jgi:hypothetical protein
MATTPVVLTGTPLDLSVSVMTAGTQYNVQNVGNTIAVFVEAETSPAANVQTHVVYPGDFLPEAIELRDPQTWWFWSMEGQGRINVTPNVI